MAQQLCALAGAGSSASSTAGKPAAVDRGDVQNAAAAVQPAAAPALGDAQAEGSPGTQVQPGCWHTNCLAMGHTSLSPAQPAIQNIARQAAVSARRVLSRSGSVVQVQLLVTPDGDRVTLQLLCTPSAATGDSCKPAQKASEASERGSMRWRGMPGVSALVDRFGGAVDRPGDACARATHTGLQQWPAGQLGSDPQDTLSVLQTDELILKST